MRPCQIGQAGSQVHRVTVGVSILVHDRAAGHADLQTHVQRLGPLAQAFGVALLHENHRLDCLLRVGKLRQHPIAQILDDAPLVGITDAPDPLRDLGDNFGDRGIAQRGIRSRAVGQIDENHGDWSAHSNRLAASVIGRPAPPCLP